VIGLLQGTQAGNTRHSKQTDIHYPGGIGTHNPSKEVAAAVRIRTRVHWDPPILTFMKRNCLILFVYIRVSFIDIVTELDCLCVKKAEVPSLQVLHISKSNGTVKYL